MLNFFGYQISRSYSPEKEQQDILILLVWKIFKIYCCVIIRFVLNLFQSIDVGFKLKQSKDKQRSKHNSCIFLFNKTLSNANYKFHLICYQKQIGTENGNDMLVDITIQFQDFFLVCKVKKHFASQRMKKFSRELQSFLLLATKNGIITFYQFFYASSQLHHFYLWNTGLKTEFSKSVLKF